MVFCGGAGIEAIAAKHAGASDVTVNDIDPVACAAAELNAELNAVVIQTSDADKVGESLAGVDVLLAGDFCYDEELSSGSLAGLKSSWIRGLKSTSEIRGVFLQRKDFIRFGVEKLNRGMSTMTQTCDARASFASFSPLGDDGPLGSVTKVGVPSRAT